MSGTGAGGPAATRAGGEVPGMWARRGVYVMEWAEFGRCVGALAAEVRASGFAPTVVCAIARGGLTAAAYLTTVLEPPRAGVVRVRRTVGDDRYAAKRAPEMETVTPLDLREDDRVLVVDDIVGTGATAELVLAELRGLAADVRLAALVRNHLSPAHADYCARVIDDWIVFPWEAGWADRPPGWRALPELP